MDYQTFLEKKKHSIGNSGFEPNYIPDIAFDFQKHIIEKAVNKGRIAIFADTGLGKTLIQLSIAENIIRHTMVVQRFVGIKSNRKNKSMC